MEVAKKNLNLNKIELSINERPTYFFNQSISRELSYHIKDIKPK